jgi:hypothetical protein
MMGGITLKRFFEIPISKKQIPNKIQINSKLQLQVTKTIMFGISILAHWNLFVIWYLPACR